MLQWLENLALRCVPDPQRRAEVGLKEIRLELFMAEQRVLEAEIHAAFYRLRLSFFEDVAKMGIEQVADQRRGQREILTPPRAGRKLTEVAPEVRTFR